MTHLGYAKDVEQLCESTVSSLLNEYENVMPSVNGLIASIERKIAQQGKGRAMAREATPIYEANLGEHP
jgi:hypothetical protein